MQLVLKGNATMGNQGSDYHVELRVRQLSARGQVQTKSTYADAAMPWSISECKKAENAASSMDPLNVTIDVETQQEREDQEREGEKSPTIRQAGATVSCALPVRLGVPGKLHIEGSQGALDVHSAALHVASTLYMGSHTPIPKEPQALRNKVEAHLDVRLSQFAGTLRTDALSFESFRLPNKALWRLGTGHVATEAWDAPLGQLHADITMPDAEGAAWHGEGKGSFRLPAQFDGCHEGAEYNEATFADPRPSNGKVAHLAVEAQGGPVKVTDLGAEISCANAAFDITPIQHVFHLPIAATYSARVAGNWQAKFGLDSSQGPDWAVIPRALAKARLRLRHQLRDSARGAPRHSGADGAGRRLGVDAGARQAARSALALRRTAQSVFGVPWVMRL